MEPSTYEFDSHHLVRDRSTGNLFPPLKLSRRESGASHWTTASSYHRSDGGFGGSSVVPSRHHQHQKQQDRQQQSQRGPSSHASSRHRRRVVSYSRNPVRSFLSAQGIRFDEDASTVQGYELPGRFDPADAKARITWFGALCLAGIGMFIEAYMIITTGQVKTVWIDQYPACWRPDKDQACPGQIECCGLFPNTPELSNGTCIPQAPSTCSDSGTYPASDLCPESLIHSISYSEFAGIMLGMVTFGKIADRVGKVRAGFLTSSIMLTGVSVMSFFSSANASTLFLMFSIFYGMFGFGVGGEYPITAMAAATHHADYQQNAALDDDDGGRGGANGEDENSFCDDGGAERRRRHRAVLDRAQTARRGETISLVFAMQGVGAVVGSAYMLFLVYFSGQTRTVCYDDDSEQARWYPSNSAGYEVNALNSIWRTFYLIGGTFIFLVVLYRTLIEEESTARLSLEERKERRKIQGRKELSSFQILRFFWPRLVGTSGCWFVLDVAFYGLKLYSGPILADLNPDGDLVVTNGYLLVYNLIGLVGYYVAASVIDRPSIGRTKLQMGSFAILCALFFLSAALFNSASPGVLMTLYFLSNFFSTFGANTTTYVMAAETYPTELRGTCHGLSAFSGKLGALLATIAFGVVDSQSIFWICGAVSAVGVVLTYVFSCDMTGVSLAEHDAQLELLMEERLSDYKGKLNCPRHLSNFEIWVGRHGEYDPQWMHKGTAGAQKEEKPVVETALSLPSIEPRKLHAGSIQEHPGGADAEDMMEPDG